MYEFNGEERSPGWTANYAKNTRGCFIVYDITNKTSFENIGKWLNKVPKDNNITICLVGNKSDLTKKREVTTEEGQKLATEKNALFFETSAKDNQNIKKIFNEMIKIVVGEEPNQDCCCYII